MKSILIAALLSTTTPALADTCSAEFPIVAQAVTDWSIQWETFKRTQAQMRAQEVAAINAATTAARKYVLLLKGYIASGCEPPSGENVDKEIAQFEAAITRMEQAATNLPNK